jgi:uncharacterized membrane protein
VYLNQGRSFPKHSSEVRMNDYDDQGSSTERLALALGWFSIGLGLAEVIAPHAIARVVGTSPSDRTNSVIRSFGAREIGTGLAILAQPNEAKWLWGRVAGDGLDLATLARVLGDEGADREKTFFAIANVAAVTALDVWCAVRLSQGGDQQSSATSMYRQRRAGIRHSITVNKSIEEAYALWRNFENFPRFMTHIASVENRGATRSVWRANAPLGITLEWESELVEDRENELIAWRSVEGSSVSHSGRVRFTPAPGARGTEVQVEMAYTPPGGPIGRAIAKLHGSDPDWQVRDGLKRYKQLLETGQLTISDGPGLRRPAQPADDPNETRRYSGVNR